MGRAAPAAAEVAAAAVFRVKLQDTRPLLEDLRPLHTYIGKCVDGGVDGAATHTSCTELQYIHTYCSWVRMLDLLPMFVSIQCVPAESPLSQPLRHPRHHWIAFTWARVQQILA